MRTHDGQSRGFGFCVFHSNRVCQRVIKTKTHVIDNRRVVFFNRAYFVGRCSLGSIKG